jgi:4-hydroxy-3-methylbut-2-enyl diphosphate reductase
MKFTAAVAVLAGVMLPCDAFVVKPSHHHGASLKMSTTEDAAAVSEKIPSKKEDRLRFMKNKQFYRKGFKEVRDDVEKTMQEQFKSELVDDLKESNYVIERNGVKVYLAKDFGFCWGVERSIALAYEAVEHFPGKRVHITNELIHNPEVNENLEKMNVQFIEKNDDGSKSLDSVQEGDVVILPAFGASYEEMDYFDKKNVEVVDTTCPWVSKVWNTVDTHQKKGLTSIIHGKYGHEETVATTSFCNDYICVKDMKEAEMVADYILNGGDKEAFLKYFEKAVSKGFDPDTMLNKVGLANQTTMYKKETRAIGQLFQKTMLKKFGPVDPQSHYMEFDTICDATQERQDAVHELVENAKDLDLDFILVIGGFDSSNTAHLLEIPVNAGVRAFHINRAECIGADNTITHRTMNGEIVTEPFIENLDKEIIMGVTSGASTPDAAVQDSLSSIFMLKSLHDNAD